MGEPTPTLTLSLTPNSTSTQVWMLSCEHWKGWIAAYVKSEHATKKGLLR